MLDPHLVEGIASALATEPGLVEKEWHVVRAIGVIAAIDHGDARPVFSGGTSLSVAWGLIKQFSEDVDFKVALPEGLGSSQARTRRRNYREKILAALTKSGLKLVGEPLSRNSSQFFRADFAYKNEFNPVRGLRRRCYRASTSVGYSLETQLLTNGRRRFAACYCARPCFGGWRICSYSPSKPTPPG